MTVSNNSGTCLCMWKRALVSVIDMVFHPCCRLPCIWFDYLSRPSMPYHTNRNCMQTDREILKRQMSEVVQKPNGKKREENERKNDADGIDRQRQRYRMIWQTKKKKHGSDSQWDIIIQRKHLSCSTISISMISPRLVSIVLYHIRNFLFVCSMRAMSWNVIFTFHTRTHTENVLSQRNSTYCARCLTFICTHTHTENTSWNSHKIVTHDGELLRCYCLADSWRNFSQCQ